MQICILDENIEKNVMAYTDRHVVKLLIEVCQIMCTVYRLSNKQYEDKIPEYIYKVTHVHHPLIPWCGESVENFQYCLDLGFALYKEYQYRYNRPDKHSKAKTILNYLSMYYITISFKQYDLTPFVRAINKEKYPELHDTNISTVEAYRQYYLKDKRHLFKWTNRPVPDWIQNETLTMV